MTKARLIPGILILLVCFSFVSAAEELAPVEGVELGPVQYYVVTDSPISGPVETFVVATHPVATRGYATDVFVVVENHSNEATVSIHLDIELIYADGRPVRPFGLGQEGHMALGPNEGFGFWLYFAVPADAPLGMATFQASARVGRITGGDEGHNVNPNPMIASDFIEFEVVP